ncbi:1-phosphofructokinase family hexose kinase [Kribbella shirazensis]|uniref:1-phosphofructokinase n=1 Tax=Kribbella shirazensis TaxID=1105143 RepID=A0A7X5VHQ5_9ACTN|nr:1-phosphofructokinase family hexose kinase [Kribbella shirazensis]NIK61496.1 1-phosphofructokinase [Kribbella shirazensis]
MIVTLTANPSVDRTIELAGELRRGEVLRAVTVRSGPGGKGVNVARALAGAGAPTVAVLPARGDDGMLAALREQAVAFHAVDVPHPVRVNVTVVEPDGTTTKLNEAGAPLADDVLDALVAAVLDEAAGARWAVLSGSLPPGVPDDWYVGLIAALRARGCAVAVDTSGEPLKAVATAAVLPDLLKPNAEELAELTGLDVAKLESDAECVADAARALIARGAGAVLATLGRHGAVLVDGDGAAYFGQAGAVVPINTVGAGDATLSGYLLADLAGAGPADRLRQAVAFGAAAVQLAGSAMPRPGDLRPDGVSVVALAPRPVAS